MFDEGRVLGILYVDTSNPLHRYHDEYLRLLATCGNLIASRLLNYQLLQERQEKQIIAAELLRASRIQQNLLQQTPPTVTGYTIGTYQVQSRQVGGDMYDAALLPDGRLLLLVADVSGKGMGAALLMSNILASFRILYEQPNFNLSKAVAQVSIELNKYSAAEDFATLFVGILDPSTGKLTYVNAGHNSPLLVRARGTIDKLNATGFMVGAFPFGDWNEETASFSSGDQLVVFTDGVTEAEGPKGLFGDEQLESLVLQHRTLSPDELEVKITEAIKAFVDNTPQSDDITMLILRRDS
jgi:sigma-B regulation protein RsbU (phosphoserine phosphatase)